MERVAAGRISLDLHKKKKLSGEKYLPMYACAFLLSALFFSV